MIFFFFLDNLQRNIYIFKYLVTSREILLKEPRRTLLKFLSRLNFNYDDKILK